MAARQKLDSGLTGSKGQMWKYLDFLDSLSLPLPGETRGGPFSKTKNVDLYRQTFEMMNSRGFDLNPNPRAGVYLFSILIFSMRHHP